MSEQFDLKKMLKSPVTPVFWSKVVMFGMGAALLFFIGYAVYRQYIKKPEPTTTNSVKAESGSTVIQNYYYARKKTFIPFIEGSTGLTSKADGPDFEIRAGLRFEF